MTIYFVLLLISFVSLIVIRVQTSKYNLEDFNFKMVTMFFMAGPFYLLFSIPILFRLYSQRSYIDYTFKIGGGVNNRATVIAEVLQGKGTSRDSKMSVILNNRKNREGGF